MAIARQCLLVTLFLTATLFTGAIRGAETPDNSTTTSTTVQPPTTAKSSTTVQPTSAAPTTAPPTPPPTTQSTTTVTTPPPSTTSSTAAPTTTVAPTSPPTTTPTPTPTPTPAPAPSKPVVGNWTIEEGNLTCAEFKAAITVNLAFTDKTNKTQHYNVYVPADAKVADPKCGVIEHGENSFSLVFPAGNVQMTFVQNNSHYYLQQVKSWINATVLPDLAKQTNETIFKVNYVAEKESLPLQGSVNSSYVCSSPAALKMTNGTMLQLASVTYQAFIKDGKLGPAQNCVTDSSPDMVPIMVAGGLILLVVLVLVAYIVTRQRQARGYHSM